MSKEIKVTDKRMFTPDGELREEYSFLKEKSTAETAAAEAAPPPMEPEPPRPSRAPEPPPAAAPDRYAAPLEPELEPGFGGFPEDGAGSPTFFDLAAMLAEPVAVYLGDMEMPGGQSSENLEMARIHIDLLDVLRQKTAGNLTSQEAAFLEDLLYQMRVRYVQKRG